MVVAVVDRLPIEVDAIKGVPTVSETVSETASETLWETVSETLWEMGEFWVAEEFELVTVAF